MIFLPTPISTPKARCAYKTSVPTVPASSFQNSAFNIQNSLPLSLAAKPPTLDDLKTMLASLENTTIVPTQKNQTVIALSDDWVTQGDWLGRYGRYWACLCSMCSPHDYLWGAGAEHVEYHARIGPHSINDDALRYWIQWLYTTNSRSLEMPPTYLHSRVIKGLTTWAINRRQSEIDDHSEAYSNTFEGPDIYFSMRIPKGQFILSLYDFNKDGHVPGPSTRLSHFDLQAFHTYFHWTKLAIFQSSLNLPMRESMILGRGA